MSIENANNKDPATKGKSSSSSGSNDSTNSTTDDERLKILFDSCDHDQDGRLDRQDFIFMCSRLNMADCAEEMMQQLGLSNDRLISFNDFIQYKRQVTFESKEPYDLRETHFSALPLDQVYTDVNKTYTKTNPKIFEEQLRKHNENEALPPCDLPYLPNTMSSWLTMSSDNSLGTHSGKPDSVDYDSGARDLSPDHVTLNWSKDASHGQDGLTPDDGYTTANTDFFARMQMNVKRNGGLSDLNNQLFSLSTDRDLLERRLGKTQEAYEERIEQTTLRYEERITELHSVIAELRKKIERHNTTVIQEVEEESEPGGSQSGGSNDGDNSSVGGDVRCSHSPSPATGSCIKQGESTDRAVDECTDNIYVNLMTTISSMKQVSPRETSSFNPSDPLLSCNHSAQSLDGGRSCIQTQQRRCMHSPHDDFTGPKCISTVLQPRDMQNEPPGHEPQVMYRSSHNPGPHSTLVSCDQCPSIRPLSKIAELKKLKSSTPYGDGSHQSLQDNDPCTIELMERISCGVTTCDSLPDLVSLLYGCCDEIAMDRARQLLLTNERLQCQVEQVRSHNSVMALTLEESRAQCERLSVLMGKYESNNTALQLAVSYSDQALEVYDVLYAFQEAEQGLLLANCRAAGLGAFGDTSEQHNQEEISAVLQQAQASHKAAESLARHLIHRLETRHMAQAPTTPWFDLSSTSSTGSSVEVDHNEKQVMRDFINQLKCDRTAVNMTVLELESIHIEPRVVQPEAPCQASAGDLEQAVLMQELMLAKEEKAALKAQNYVLEKEKRGLELRLAGKESHEKVYLVQIEQLKSEIGDASDTRLREVSPQTLVHGHNLEESMKREQKLKNRVQELVGTLEKLSRNSETRHQQSSEFITDLKRANSALISAFEKAKKKYQTRIKKLECQLENFTATSHTQISRLNQRIAQLEADSHDSRVPNETSL